MKRVPILNIPRKKLKVLQINPYPPEKLGGSEIFCQNLALFLHHNKNIDSDILTSDMYRNGIKTRYIDNSVRLVFKRYYFNIWNMNPVMNILPFLQNNIKKYDIVHAHSYIFLTSLQTALFRKLRKFPFVLHIHGGVQTAEAQKIKHLKSYQMFFKNLIFDTAIGKLTIKNADSIISVSKKDMLIIQRKYHIGEDKLHYIPNGIDINRFNRIESVKKEYITFIGRLTYIKGIDLFIKLIERIYEKEKNCKFLIIGNGPLQGLVNIAKRRLPIKHILKYPYENIQNVYNHSKLLVITSRFEGLPTIILESLACKTPVVTIDVGGISEVISNDNNGILVQNLENDAIIEKILLLINDEDKLYQYGNNGRKLIEREYSWDIIGKKIETIYRNLLTK